MKNYNKILEAVNRGIQLALDDYQDIEPNNSISQSNDVIDTEDVIQDKIKLNELTVDMGLPSKTRWAKYNLGVIPNNRKLRYAKNWKGEYYAWGETRPNIGSKWSTYKFSAAGYAQLTKYCTDSNFGMLGFNDGLNQLLPEDDITTITLGKHFHIPTKEQWEELIKYTTSYWTDNYKGIKGLAGRVFVSDEVDNEIFIPKYNQYDDTCYSMSSNISNIKPFRSYILTASKDYGHPNLTPNSRVDLMPIRPVYNK